MGELAWRVKKIGGYIGKWYAILANAISSEKGFSEGSVREDHGGHWLLSPDQIFLTWGEVG